MQETLGKEARSRRVAEAALSKGRKEVERLKGEIAALKVSAC